VALLAWLTGVGLGWCAAAEPYAKDASVPEVEDEPGRFDLC
jgi:hypothetical protein